MNEFSAGFSLFIILLVAVLTFGARLFPFVVFSRTGKVPAVVSYIGNMLPPAVMIMLVIYCIRYITPMAWPHGIPELLCIGVVVLLYKFTKNYLIAMVGSTILYMVLVQVVFI